MPTITESLASQATPLQATLDAGIDVLSQQQTVIFYQYQQVILPADGFIFWLKTNNFISVQGSFHFSGDQRQNEDETLGMSHVIFTSEHEINDFTAISPQAMYIGIFNNLRFAFNHKKNFYKESHLWHYVGDAIYAPMESQFIDTIAEFDEITPVVSNSLPIWLALNALMPIYPSFAVPANIAPPYASVHIEPSSTQALQSVPLIDPFTTHSQLVFEDVRFTVYGARNTNALDFQDYLYQNSLDTDNWGLMNCAIMQDEKRIQSEYGILAMKKTFTLKVSYYQSRVQEIARQLILSAKVTFLHEGI